MARRVIVWGENVHERKNAAVRAIYPNGMHGAIADLLLSDPDLSVETATLQEPEHGLTAARLADCDVLIWWGHAAHGDVSDDVVDRVVEAVWSGMGLIALHSAHFSKVFKRLMGSPCSLSWREAGERERIWVVNPRHPISRDLPPSFTLEQEEMYAEPFLIPEPLETVMIGWFQGGEVFRAGVTFRRGAGNIFYFQPGHEVYPTYHDPVVGKVLRNAVHWAASGQPRLADVTAAPNVPAEEAPEPLTARGPRIHADGEDGFR